MVTLMPPARCGWGKSRLADHRPTMKFRSASRSSPGIADSSRRLRSISRSRWRDSRRRLRMSFSLTPKRWPSSSEAAPLGRQLGELPARQHLGEELLRQIFGLRGCHCPQRANVAIDRLPVALHQPLEQIASDTWARLVQSQKQRPVCWRKRRGHGDEKSSTQGAISGRRDRVLRAGVRPAAARAPG